MRLLRYLWAGPASWIGPLLAALGVVAGGRIARHTDKSRWVRFFSSASVAVTDLPGQRTVALEAMALSFIERPQ
jgi:hypothetical protein